MYAKALPWIRIVPTATCKTTSDRISDSINNAIDHLSRPPFATSFIYHISPRDSRLPFSYATREIEKSTSPVQPHK